MDGPAFLARQTELRERLRHAVPRSARAIKLAAELKALMTTQLRGELGPDAPAAPAVPVAEPPADFADRFGEGARAAAAAPYGGAVPYWVDH